MQFVHISDNHLGYRQYNLDERERDFYNNFNECIDKILEIKPDFVVHSGDLFEKHSPNIAAIHTAIKGFLKLKEKNIPIYMIHGNHDIPNRKYKKSPFVILKSILGDYLRTFTKRNYHIFEKNGKEIFIAGSDYTKKEYMDNLFEKYRSIEKESKDYKKKILIFHQSISYYTDIPLSDLQISDFPKGFDYYAGGHIHDRALTFANNGNGKQSVLGYAGSTELRSRKEYDGYLQNGKGFYLVDMSGKDFDLNDIQKIDLKCREFIIDKTVKNEYDLNLLMEEVKRKNNPIVFARVRRDYLENLRSFLDNNTLYNKITLLDEITEELDIESKTIDELFREYIQLKNYDEELIYGIYGNVLENNDIGKYLKDYFEKCWYNNDNDIK